MTPQTVARVAGGVVLGLALASPAGAQGVDDVGWSLRVWRAGVAGDGTTPPTMSLLDARCALAIASTSDTALLWCDSLEGGRTVLTLDLIETSDPAAPETILQVQASSMVDGKAFISDLPASVVPALDDGRLTLQATASTGPEAAGPLVPADTFMDEFVELDIIGAGSLTLGCDVSGEPALSIPAGLTCSIFAEPPPTSLFESIEIVAGAPGGGGDTLVTFGVSGCSSDSPSCLDLAPVSADALAMVTNGDAHLVIAGSEGPATIALSSGCRSSSTQLCLDGGFEAKVTRTDTNTQPTACTATKDSGIVSFADQTGPLLVKIKNACEINGHYWVVVSNGLDNGTYELIITTPANEQRSFTIDPQAGGDQVISEIEAFTCLSVESPEPDGSPNYGRGD